MAAQAGGVALEVFGVRIQLVGDMADLAGDFGRSCRDSPQLDSRHSQKGDLMPKDAKYLVVGHPNPSRAGDFISAEP